MGRGVSRAAGEGLGGQLVTGRGVGGDWEERQKAWVGTTTRGVRAMRDWDCGG